MRSIADALADILPAFQPLGSERVGLDAALGRILSAQVLAREDSPPFSNSAMDGYAVRAADVAGAGPATPVSLPLVGESRAGGAPPPALAPGSAMRIFTGAPLPAGADAIVMQEDTEREEDRVAFLLAPPVGHHVRARAEDIAAGSELLPAGTRLGPGEVGLLAGQGHAALTVGRRPRVALLSTGDELRDVSDPPAPGTIVNSNAYALAAQVREAGGVPWVLPICPDRLEPTVAAIHAGLTADVLVSIGGVSVGDYDLVKEAFQAAGVTQQFWKVSMKPGKPLSFGLASAGRARPVPVVGLPGNPVSAMVTFEVFVRPGLRRMLGDPLPFRAAVTVRLAEAARHSTGRTELARARLATDAEGLVAHLHPRQGSGSLSSMVGVEALVVLPADQASFAVGERLRAVLVSDAQRAAESPF